MSETITYVIGNGPNQVQIPLLAFTTEAQARSHVESLGLVASHEGDYDHVVINGQMIELYDALGGGYRDAEAGTPQADEIASLPDIVHMEILHSQWTGKDFLQVWHGVEGRLARALFAGGQYYGGCGECGSLSLVTVAVGVPPVGWNLD